MQPIPLLDPRGDPGSITRLHDVRRGTWSVPISLRINLITEGVSVGRIRFYPMNVSVETKCFAEPLHFHGLDTVSA